MNKDVLTQQQIAEQAKQVAELIATHQSPKHLNVKLYGVPRGGVAVAYLVQHYLKSGFACESTIVNTPETADVILDDLIDSGATQERYCKKYPEKGFYALYTKKLMDDPTAWLVFPWEQADDEAGGAADIAIRLLQYIGEDPDRGGLRETPKRFIKAWDHWSSGYGQNPKDILKVFKDGAEKCSEMVIVRDIPVYSHCEHHLAPFFGVAHIGYIPDGSIVGLSKLSRLVDVFAKRLQVQERLTNQIADAMEEHLKPLGVAVVVNCRHLCMESRGIQRQGSSTTTSAMRGVLMDNPAARAEFMQLIK